MMTWAVVQATFQGQHCWPGAPEGKHQHLQNPHRHLFHVKLSVQQFHDDRDIEFLAFRDKLEDQLAGLGFDLGHRSCEMMATSLITWAQAELPDRKVKCEVFEDGENGALVET